MPAPAPLAERVGRLSQSTPSDLLEHFLEWVGELGLTLYPAQEEAILALFEGQHVILATPTGSGKSLVATAMVFRTLANGGRAFYTCPIKALVNEKFFQLSDAFGPANVGMMTGDAAINTGAPVICCTAEIAASIALRQGIDGPIDALIMDEFHYYADKERGAAWHVPLLILSRTRFLLMSATLGDATPFLERLRTLTKREAVLVESKDRPVPLEFSYAEEPLQETVKQLVERGRAPVYIVCFTQRACADEAQKLTSENYTSKEEKRAILEALEGFRFDSPYGKDVARFVKHGIGLHHAGLLPKYRLLVERLAQKGLLKVICGTDTLGVGVNIPIRTVLFTKLCKFDGEKVGLLTAREFHQIAGRAGRKGFDDLGTVVVQAPEHVIENIRIDRKKESDPKKYKNLQRAKAPLKGYVHWDRQTFDQLLTKKPEDLIARFSIGHGMLIDLLDRADPGKRGGYGLLLDLIERAHLSERDKRAQRKLAPLLFRSLRRAGLIQLSPRPSGRGRIAHVATDLQRDFSLMSALSLWLVDFVDVLFEGKTDEAAYALDVLSAVEAVCESPKAILERQLDRLKAEKIAELKAAGVEYDERMAELEKVELPKPNAEAIYATFAEFSVHHPWIGAENIKPKSIARDMYERYATFDEYVRELDLSRMEGLLLRYLSEVMKTLAQTVPERRKTDALDELTWFLEDQVRGIDSSLLDEWEERLAGGKPKAEKVPEKPKGLRDDPKALLVRARRDAHRVLKLLSVGDFEGLAKAITNPEDWPAATLTARGQAYVAEKGRLLVHHEARRAEFTTLERDSEHGWKLHQTMVDDQGHNDWALSFSIDLGEEPAADAPLLALRAIGPV